VQKNWGADPRYCTIRRNEIELFEFESQEKNSLEGLTMRLAPHREMATSASFAIGADPALRAHLVLLAKSLGNRGKPSQT